MWAKLNDQFLRNRKLRAAGKDATMLYLAAILHCCESLTDGIILDSELPLVAAAAFLSPSDLPALVTRLERPIANMPEARLWERVEGGYRIGSFLDYNPRREDVIQKRDRESRRKAEWRASHRTEAGTFSDAPTSGPTASSEVDAPRPHRPVPVPVPVPVPTPVPVPPPVRSDEADEVREVLSVLDAEETDPARRTVERAIDAHLATDPVAVALDYMRWRETVDREGGKIHRNQVTGWNTAMRSAAARGLYRRREPDEEMPPSEPPEIAPSAIPLWDEVRSWLLLSLGPDPFRQWFAPLEAAGLEDDVLTLLAPDDYHRDWLAARLAGRLQEALEAAGRPEVRPRFIGPADGKERD